jgi:hypothetical protein
MMKRANKKLNAVSPAGKVLHGDKSHRDSNLRKKMDVDEDGQTAGMRKKVGHIEPYVTVKLGSQKFTSAVSKGLNPSWVEDPKLKSEFTFDVPSAESLKKSNLLVACYDEDLQIGDLDDLIGKGALFEFEEWPSFTEGFSLSPAPIVRLSGLNAATLSEEYRGEITFEMEYKRGSTTFTLTLIKADHLKNVDEADSSDLSKSTFVIVQCILALLLYLVLGIFGFKGVEPEWTYIDAFYFAVITMTTIGYGDLKPSSAQSKIFSVAYGLIGIAYIGAAMGILGGALMESVSAKMATTPKVGAGDVDPEEHPEKVLEEAEIGKDRCCSQQTIARSRTVGCWTFVMMLNVVGGGVFLAWLEGQDIGDMIYLGFVTLTTIGYGDFYPVSQGGRLFTAFWAMIGTVIVANMLSILAGFIVEDQQDKLRYEILNRRLDSNTLINWDKDGDGNITECEYLQARLKQLEICTEHEIELIMSSFRKHDSDGTGSVNFQDIVKAHGKEV